MARLRNFWRRLTGWITVPRAVALLLGLLGVLIGGGGYLYRYCACQDWPNLVAGWEQLYLDFYANVATTLVGITIAVLTIDLLNERRAEQQLKAQLIREMGHPTDNGVALRAVRELKAHGWLEDGSLQEANLQGANLQGANLQGANLQSTHLDGTNLRRANLQGANLQGAFIGDTKLQGADLRGANLHWINLYWAGEDDQQLVTARDLEGATMRDGSRYDGRFNLEGDLMSAEFFGFSLEDPDAMARYYRVPLEIYLAGQEWARENLPELLGVSPEEYQHRLESIRREVEEARAIRRREAGLEQEEAAETGEASQPEEPQSVAPSSDVPPSPLVPTQSLLSFTVRRLIGLFWPFGRI